MITQQQVDDVAAFVEVAEELRAEPFFGEDEHTTLIGRTSAEFGTPANLKSALAPFRRIWMKGEPCYFEHICNLLYADCQHGPTREFIGQIREQFRREVKTPQFPVLPNETSPVPGDTVDLWLNTRFAHVGKSGRHGRFTPADFEKHEQAIGKAKFEFLFRSAILRIGSVFINLMQVAKVAMGFWKDQMGLKPTRSVRVAFGRVGVEAGPDGTIRRDTLGWSPSNETSEQRFERLLRRDRFSHLRQLVDMLQPIPGDPPLKNFLQWADVVGASCISDIVNKLGYRIVQVADLSEHKDSVSVTSFFDPRTFRKGTASRKRGALILWSEEYLPILDDSLKEFRQVFASKG